jgi:signal transduction histidine kinase
VSAPWGTMDAETLLRAAQVVVFVGLAALSFVHWRRHRGPAGWLAGSFTVLAVAILLGRIGPPVDTTAGFVVQKAQVVSLALFPYFLYRFKCGFVDCSRYLRVTAAAVTAAVAVWVVALAEPLSAEAAAPLHVRGAVFLLLAQWVLLSVVVATGLWRAGSGQPPVARARMRTLGLGALVLTVALLLAGFAPGLGAAPPAVALAAGLVFYLGFAPPRMLRVGWRQPLEAALWDVERELATTTSAEEVGLVILPTLCGTLGADAAALADLDGHLVAAHPLDADAPEGLLWGQGDDRIAIRVRHGTLAVRLSRFAPYGTAEDEDVLRAFGTVTDLALDRVDLYARERAFRRAEEAARQELEALVYGLSHDLKNPVVSILGYAELLSGDYADSLDADGREFLERMAANADYMRLLLNDLLELSRVGRVDTEPSRVVLTELAKRVAAEVRRHHPASTWRVSPGVSRGQISSRRGRGASRPITSSSCLSIRSNGLWNA